MMVSKRKKKYSTGEGDHFYTRKQALKKLQVSLTQFRRLCILKGIYPREPINRKRAQKGDPGIKTLYHKKDIRFLMHDPIMWKIRDYKIFHRKYGRAKALKDFETMKRYLRKYPEMKIDHIIKERYPTFIDALRDLDDCLTLCFLFSTFPSLEYLPREQFVLCRRLTVEFLHAVIEAKALRKVFISIKGYYYQAELKGQTITWIVPHHFQFQPQSKAEVDFRLMSIFVEFYTVMLGFVNFRLYHSLNLHYPPKFSGIAGPSDYEKCLVDEDSYVSERIASLNFPISRTGDSQEEEVEIDSFETDDDPLKVEENRKEAEKVKKLKTLFKGLKFYLNREVPREPLVFIIRCFGGEVSWDSTVFLGATFDESDETITHQIVDRPGMEKQYISRYYVQPQWVFDCVNARDLLPEQKYFLGVDLPPHLSPFTDPNRDQQYVPPEEEALRNQLLQEQKDDDENVSDESEDDDKGEDKSEDEDNENEEEAEKTDESSDDDNDSNEETREIKKAKKAKMAVTPGQVYKESPWEEQMQEKQAFKLREKMVKKKYKNLYRSMKAGRQKRVDEIKLLKRKRRIIDQQAAEQRKAKKKAVKSN